MKVATTLSQAKEIDSREKFLEIDCAHAQTPDHDQVEQKLLQKEEIFVLDLEWNSLLQPLHNTTKIKIEIRRLQ